MKVNNCTKVLLVFYFFLMGSIYQCFGKNVNIIRPEFIVIPEDHNQVVMTGVNELVTSFCETGDSIKVIKESNIKDYHLEKSFVIIGFYETNKLIKKIEKTNTLNISREAIGDEGYAIKVVSNPWSKGKVVIITSFTERGLLYGSYRLSKMIQDSAGLPLSINVVTKPFFKIREWETMTFQANFNLPMGGAFDRPPEEMLALTKKIIRKAPYYGINALQLTGRPGEGGMDLSWILKYRKYPKVYRYYKYDHGRDERIRIIREVAIECHKYGMEFLMWDHELLYPRQLLREYPELKGSKYPLTHEAMIDLIHNKVDEFFEVAPEVDGIVLTFSEVGGGFFLFDAGPQVIHDVAMAMYEACKRNGKRLEARSYYATKEEGKMMEEAFKGTPEDLVVMSKCVPYDFFGTKRLHNPIFGKVSNTQIAEFTTCREDNGHGFIPGIAPLHYKRKLLHEIDKGIDGVAARVDYHLQYSHAHGFNPGPAETTFDRPNEFDAVSLSRMMWNPHINLDSLWLDWAGRKYGKKAAPYLVSALKRTEDITQKTFFVMNEYVIHQHNQITSLKYMKNGLSGPTLQHYWDTSNKTLAERARKINHPTEDILNEFLQEKREAIQLANLSLEDIRNAQPYMDTEVYSRLYRSMQIEKEAAVLWQHLTEMFFRYLMWEQETGDTETNLAKLNAAGQSFLEQASSIEAKHGRTWPVYRAARGIYSYYVILEFYIPQLLKIIDDSSEIEQIYEAINLLVRPKRVSDVNRLRVKIHNGIKQIKFEGKNIKVYSKSNKMIAIPVGIDLTGKAIQEGNYYNLTFQRVGKEVKITSEIEK